MGIPPVTVGPLEQGPSFPHAQAERESRKVAFDSQSRVGAAVARHPAGGAQMRNSVAFGPIPAAFAEGSLVARHGPAMRSLVHPRAGALVLRQDLALVLWCPDRLVSEPGSGKRYRLRSIRLERVVAGEFGDSNGALALEG